jgi:hypothetical protein
MRRAERSNYDRKNDIARLIGSSVLFAVSAATPIPPELRNPENVDGMA